MNRQIAFGHIKQIAGTLCEYAGRLSSNRLSQLRGRQLVVLGKLQVVYGEAIELARTTELAPATSGVTLGSRRRL